MADQLSAFAGAQDRTDEQKKALMQQIAQQGTAGAQAYKDAQDQTNTLRSTALGQAQSFASTSPLNGNAAAVTQPVADNFAMRQADLSQGAETFNQDIAREQSANAGYFDKVSASVPIVESRTRAAVEQIIRQQQEAEAERQNRLQLQQLQLQQAMAEASGSNNPSVSEQIAQAREGRDSFCFDNPDDPKCLDASGRKTAADETAKAAQQDRLNRTLAAESPRVASVIREAMTYDDPIAYLRDQVGKGLESASTADKGGKGKGHVKGSLNYEYLRDRVNSILSG